MWRQIKYHANYGRYCGFLIVLASCGQGAADFENMQEAQFVSVNLNSQWTVSQWKVIRLYQYHSGAVTAYQWKQCKKEDLVCLLWSNSLFFAYLLNKLNDLWLNFVSTEYLAPILSGREQELVEIRRVRCWFYHYILVCHLSAVLCSLPWELAFLGPWSNIILVRSVCLWFLVRPYSRFYFLFS